MMKRIKKQVEQLLSEALIGLLIFGTLSLVVNALALIGGK